MSSVNISSKSVGIQNKGIFSKFCVLFFFWNTLTLQHSKVAWFRTQRAKKKTLSYLESQILNYFQKTLTMENILFFKQITSENHYFWLHSKIIDFNTKFLQKLWFLHKMSNSGSIFIQTIVSCWQPNRIMRTVGCHYHNQSEIEYQWCNTQSKSVSLNRN